MTAKKLIRISVDLPICVARNIEMAGKQEDVQMKRKNYLEQVLKEMFAEKVDG